MCKQRMHFEMKSNVENCIGVSKKARHRDVGGRALNRERLARQTHSGPLPFRMAPDRLPLEESSLADRPCCVICQISSDLKSHQISLPSRVHAGESLTTRRHQRRNVLPPCLQTCLGENVIQISFPLCSLI